MTDGGGGGTTGHLGAWTGRPPPEARNEIHALAEAMPPSYRPVTHVAVWTGVRENEALGLVWGDIDLQTGKIHLTAQLSRPRKDQPAERVPIKNEQGTLD